MMLHPRAIKFIWICFILPLSCSDRKLIADKVQIHGFNSKKWKDDSLSCNNKRPALTDILINNRALLINLTRQQILILPGKPNGDKYSIYGYFIENGTQCLNKNEKDYTGNQTKLLLIEFKNDVVADVYKIFP